MGHSDVQERYVGPVLAHEFDRLASVGGLGNDLDGRVGRQDGRYPDTDRRLVVREYHPDHRRSAPAAGADGRCAVIVKASFPS
ncbi:hypothetical protein NKG94_22820 [Micromonospora sp. M12]